MSRSNSKKAILFFLPLPPPVHGAALRNKSLVESQLIRHSFNVIVIPFNFVDSNRDIGKFSFTKIFRAITRAFEIVGSTARYKPDLVYFNISLYGFALYRDFIYVILFRMFSPRLVYHLRTQGVNMQISKSKFKLWMFREIFANSDVICLSERLSYDIKGAFSRKPFIVNNGIEDLSPRYPKLTSRNRVVTILFISNLSRSKGVLELIESFKILKSNGIKFSAWIVGNPADLTEQFLQTTLLQMGLGDEVKLLGPKYGDEKCNLLRAADLFVLPTYFEAFPGVILEAMQFELPVVSTREGAIPEIIDDGKNGFIVEKRDVAGLASKIEQLAADPEMRRKFGANGREKFLTHYTLDRFEKNMKVVFDTILSKETRLREGRSPQT